MPTIKDYCDCGGVLVDGQLLMFNNVDEAVAMYNRLTR
jgi:capsular polysaccharide transport system ATP-binding protein